MQLQPEPPPTADEERLPLPCPFCESHPILRTRSADPCVLFRCPCCRKVWGVPATQSPS